MCLYFIKTLHSKNILYFGDLDATSIFTYLTFKYLKREPKNTDKPKLHVKFAGISMEDYNKYLHDKNCLIKISNQEQDVLGFIEDFKLLELKKELKFIKEKNAKVELEAMGLYGFEEYFKNKIFT